MGRVNLRGSFVSGPLAAEFELGPRLLGRPLACSFLASERKCAGSGPLKTEAETLAVYIFNISLLKFRPIWRISYFCGLF